MWSAFGKYTSTTVLKPIRYALVQFASLQITTKFGLSFGLLTVVVLLEMGIGSWALNAVWKADKAIQANAEIQRLVMTMGRNWESARRSELEFFLYSRGSGQSRSGGAENAYRVYALASASKINEVIRDGAMLKRTLTTSETPAGVAEQSAKLDLILSTASQYAATLDVATKYELQLVTSDSGLHYQRMRWSDEVLAICSRSAEQVHLKALFYELRFFQEERQTDIGDGNPPSLAALYAQLQSEFERSSLSTESQAAANNALLQYQQLSETIDRVETQLAEARITLDRLGGSIEPTLIELMAMANLAMGRTRLEIEQTRQLASRLLGGIAIVAAALAIIVAILLHYSVTRQVTRLTHIANQMRSGDLSVRAHPNTTDEIGQLALTLNAMATQLSATFERMNVVRQAGVELTSELDVDKVSATALRTAIELSGADAGFLALVEDHALRVTQSIGAYPRGFVGTRCSLDVTELADLLALRRIAPRTGRACPEFLAGRVCLPIPLAVGHEVIGVLILESSRPGFPAAELTDILELYATSASIAIHNALIYGNAQQMAVVDALTGLYNRRGFSQSSIAPMMRVIHRRLNASLIFLDIDHFKQFNDRYSYAVGDLVLRTIADTLRAAVEDVGLICRYGGEEFVILLPEVSLFQAAALAERLRQTVETTAIHTDQATLAVTISLGVSTWMPESTTTSINTVEEIITQLIETTGRMLHIAKSSGRNRVAVASTYVQQAP